MAEKKRRAAVILCAACLIGGMIGIGMGSVGYGEQGADNGRASDGSGPPALQTEKGASQAAALRLPAAKGQHEPPSANTPQEIQALVAMEKAAENDTLQLYVNRATAEIAVKDKRDGYSWFSNPPGREADPKASPLYKSELSSQVLVTYYNDKGQVNTFNSYDDSVAKKQFDISAKDNGLKVVYHIGNIAKGYANIPKAISKERFQTQILDRIQDKDTREDVAFKFSLDEEKQIYTVRKLQDYVAEEISATLEKAGYTAEEAARDNKENGAGDASETANAEFTVPVEYTLDGEHLVVSVPGKELAYNKAYPLATVQVLKFFGAAGTDKSGYLFVPDGSGALIHLNSGKQQAEPYSLPVYGNDGSFDVKEHIQTNEITRLPVFGMKQNDHAMLGIIEDGDALAGITADVSGRNDSYNAVSSKFQVAAMDFYTLTSGTKTSAVPMFQSQTYEGSLKLRYAFLSGAAANYVGMAEQYRTYLAGKYQLKPLDDAEEAPFILELDGAFRKRKSFLGIPYPSTESLTSFDEAQTLLKQLKQAGVDKIDLRYVGWFNGGINHSSPSSISITGALGGSSGFRDLTAYAKQNGIGFYPDVAFLEKYKGAAGAATFLDRSKAAVYRYDPVMYAKDTERFSHYILSPAVLPKQVDRFLSDYADTGNKGLSLRDMGNEVNSDFDPGKTVNRQDALRTIAKQTSKLKQQAGSLMVNGGNAYSLPYADVIVNAPVRSSRMNITDEDIPFYQIALHGYYDLAGAPFNMDELQNPRLSMLQGLETGSNVFYQWYYSDSTKVKDTDYNDLYGLGYRSWFDEAVKLYNESKTVLGSVRNQMIVKHEKLAPGIVQTTFGNGTTITINYNHTAVAVNGLQIEAEGYRVGGE
ncbi:DUF5696 domain-containing protein [Paenibacillus sp. R14(2021)]|uniref:DUF5696 domain-containing protein n=1 Tax=Paenibacillus sp. R14(2021) TaxID=2859228 RepID=UPI001C61438C|nr:DUF5696 domain-containing protein [Paenibacillus sp. R14(2021)]